MAKSSVKKAAKAAAASTLNSSGKSSRKSSDASSLALSAPASSLVLSNERPDGAEVIKNAKLVRFENRTQVRRYTVEFSCPEFTCVCPASGFPDFATIHIRYIPRKWCVELKSLKLYLNQFRDRGIFHEDVTNVILDDMIQLLDPHEIEVVGDFNVRGNIKTVVSAIHHRKDK